MVLLTGRIGKPIWRARKTLAYVVGFLLKKFSAWRAIYLQAGRKIWTESATVMPKELQTQLSDNERRDVIKYLEAGKPLPEKYRFLLFSEAQEVELLWNGKTNEVTNVVLPFQVIEQIDKPRSDKKIGLQDSLFDTSGRQITGWTNKLDLGR